MGQHRIQKQILRNLSFGGRQSNSRETWYLRTVGSRPTEHSIRSVGVFKVDCSEDVDDYITDLEEGFKDSLRRFSHGNFTKTDVGREIYDFIAMHYVRSKHVVCVGNQQKWHTLGPERSGVVLRSGELPEGPVVLSSPLDCLSPRLPSTL